MKNRLLLLMLCWLSLMACTPKTPDFTYAPTEPRAGEKIVFTNHSDFGEIWAWSFGDNVYSTLKSPTHIYKKAGEYTVSLMVDSISRYTVTKTIIVYDSVPSFACNVDTIPYYTPVTFNALVWNPFGKNLSYQWKADSSAVLTSATDQSQLTCYFTQFNRPVSMELTVTLGDETFNIKHTFEVKDRPAAALLFRTDENDFAQRIYPDELYENPHIASYSEAALLLDAVQDSIASYGDQTIGLADLIVEGHSAIKGLMIDPMAMKVYFRDNTGIFVANINGTLPVQIDDEANALYLDKSGNRIYWSNSRGVWRMPLVYSANNRFTETATQMNTESGASRLAVDNTLR